MSDLATRRTLPEALNDNQAVEASPFVHEGGQYLQRTGAVGAEQVMDLVGRYEERLDGLVDKVTEQAGEVTELTRTLELERRAAQGARHRLQVSQLEAKSEVDEAQFGAERSRLEAARDVDVAAVEARYAQVALDKTQVELAATKARLAALEQLQRTPWYAFARRRELRQVAGQLPSAEPAPSSDKIF
ncbi:MAG: hypothetical protein ACI9OJ_000220 [Myxococcota bacterium]|jgi:hypothetical protein